MKPWTLAPSLAELREQINTAWPSRSKASDGTIGDAAHAATKSEHNPDAQGVVRAFDITHDPVHGPHGTTLAMKLVGSRDPRILYVIWNRRIARSYPKPGIPAWTWSRYTGADPHTNHVHLSVVSDGRANSTTPWRISATPTEEDPLAQFTDDDLKANAAEGVWGAEVGRSDITAGVMLQRIYAVLANPDVLADKVAAKLSTTAYDPADPAAVKKAVKDALREGVQ